MGAVNKDSVLGASLVLVVSLVLLLGVSVYFQTSLSLLQQQVDNDREQMSQYQVLLASESRLGLSLIDSYSHHWIY